MSDMTLEQFREAKQSGVDLYADIPQEVQEDAAPIEEEAEEQQETVVEESETSEESETVEDTEEIPPEQKNAFYKRMQRERKKAVDEAEASFNKKLEDTLNPYKSFFDSLGLDPQKAMELIETNRMKQEAENLAYQNGWSEEQTQMFMRQQQQDKEMRDLRVSVQINDLADGADYPGIKQMKAPIVDFMKRNPSSNVTEAYWAVGGANLAQQLKREAEQREIAKRSQPKRTVVTDAPSNNKGPAPLPPEAVAFMRQNNMTEAQVRQLMQDDFPKDLESFRKMKQGRK